MVNNLTFITKISGHTPDGMEIRGVPLEQLVAETSFVESFFLSLVGRKPTAAEERLLNALMVSAMDHGVQPPSNYVARVIAASGNSILQAMAGTLLALGPYHGGAIETSMAILSSLADEHNVEKAATELVKKYRANKQRVPGFGHAVYKNVDPRAEQLFGLAQESGMDDSFILVAKTLEHTIEAELGRHLVINVDGAFAVILLTMGIDQKAGNALFALARVAGTIAHIIEEQKSEQWVRRLDEQQVEYKQ